MAAPGSLTDFLGHVALVYPLLGTPEAMRRVVHEAVVDAAADGILYLELRFGPATHARPGFGLDQVVAAACDGVASGVAATGMPAGIVVCALRHHDDATNADVATGRGRHAPAGASSGSTSRATRRSSPTSSACGRPSRSPRPRASA